MAHKLGLDVGTKTCGVAISDALNMTAQGKTVLYFASHDWSGLCAQLATFFNDYAIESVVIGYPTYPSGDKSATTLAIEAAAQAIAMRFARPVIFVREDFSSKAAQAILLATGASRAKRRVYEHIVAAQLILQEHLDAQR